MMSCHLPDEAVHVPAGSRESKKKPQRRLSTQGCCRTGHSGASPRAKEPQRYAYFSPPMWEFWGRGETARLFLKEQQQKATHPPSKPLRGINLQGKRMFHESTDPKNYLWASSGAQPETGMPRGVRYRQDPGPSTGQGCTG